MTQIIGNRSIEVLQVNLKEGIYSKIELYTSKVDGSVNGTVADAKVPSKN